jgi:hypothetical protein
VQLPYTDAGVAVNSRPPSTSGSGSAPDLNGLSTVAAKAKVRGSLHAGHLLAAAYPLHIKGVAWAWWTAAAWALDKYMGVYLYTLPAFPHCPLAIQTLCPDLALP